MNTNRRLTICLAVLTVSGVTPACRATTPVQERPPVAGGTHARDARPRSDIWIAYSPSGLTRSTASNAGGSETVTIGHLRPPIFSARIRSMADDGIVEADLLMPAGFDRRYVRVEDIRENDPSGGPESNAALRHERLEQALMHHRPAVRLRIDAKGAPHVEITSEFQRHEACERRLLRAAAQARLAGAQDDVQKRSQQLRLEGLDDNLAQTSSSYIGSASLLLWLVMQSLPSSAEGEDAQPRAGVPSRLPDQWDWRAEQIRVHGRPVRLQLDLRAASSSPAAPLCRSLAFNEISEPRSDTCTIEGVIDQRDGWPIKLTILRRGEAANGTTEAQSRTFDRLAPLEGFVAPPNPCSA